MGLLKAALVFIIGNFAISILEKRTSIIYDIPVIGDIYGDDIISFTKKNKCLALLIIITIVEFIL